MAETRTDAVTVATIWHYLQTTAREMRHIIDRTAQNYLIGQLHDVSVGIWAAHGETVAVPVGLPVQFMGSGFAVRSIIEKFGDDLAAGDAILTNDPYDGGHNCHLPDWGFFRPIFYDGELLFWDARPRAPAGHRRELPGGLFPRRLRHPFRRVSSIPPDQGHAGGVERTETSFFELIWNNVRWPRGVRLDNYSMIASTTKAPPRSG